MQIQQSTYPYYNNLKSNNVYTYEQLSYSVVWKKNNDGSRIALKA